MALMFEDMTPAGAFGDTCETSIMDLRALCPDEVLRTIPRFVVRYEDGTEMPILLDDNYEITRAVDLCEPSIASREMFQCRVILPNQKLVAVGFDELNYTNVMRRFCGQKRLMRFPTLFTRNGEFDEGNPVAGDFLLFLLAELRGPLMAHLRSEAWNGDQDDIHGFHGILTQLTEGPIAAGDGCDLYRPVVADWDVMVNTPGTAAHPDATIHATQDDFTIHGQAFAGNTGLDLVHFLRSWLERLLEHDLSAFADDDIVFDLWIGRGQTSCIADAAACMQPCGLTEPLQDPGIRERAGQFRRNKQIWLYPYDNITINLVQSPMLQDTMVFFPRSINGRPLIAWTFRDQAEQVAILNGALPFYGHEAGLPDAMPPLYPENLEGLDEVNLFETRAFSLNVQRNGNCLNAWINTETAILMFGVHLWLIINGVSCSSLIPMDCGPTGLAQAVTACATTATPGELSLTVAALEVTYGITIEAGDVFKVNFADGNTQLLGTVVSYTEGTEALILAFENTGIDCDTGGGPTSVALLHDAA